MEMEFAVGPWEQMELALGLDDHLFLVEEAQAQALAKQMYFQCFAD